FEGVPEARFFHDRLAVRVDERFRSDLLEIILLRPGRNEAPAREREFAPVRVAHADDGDRLRRGDVPARREILAQVETEFGTHRFGRGSETKSSAHGAVLYKAPWMKAN